MQIRYWNKKVYFKPRQADHPPDRRSKAYLTVFLSLCLPIILSLFLTLIEGARLNAIRMQTEITVDTAVDSVLAEFHQELLLQYDLLMIDTSYGTGNPSLSRTQSHLLDYIEKNLSSTGTLTYGNRDFTSLSVSDVSISDTRFAADNNCASLREQITAYMSAEPLGDTVIQFMELFDEYEDFSADQDSYDWQEWVSENKKEIQEGLEEETAFGSEQEGEENEDAQMLEEAESFVEEEGVSSTKATNLFDTLDQLVSLPLLTQIFGGTSSLSQSSVDTDDYLSHRSVHEGDGATAENSHGYTKANEIVFDLYAFEKCGNYANPLEKSELSYQIEYLLYGKESDLENLEKTVQTLFLIRLAANLIAIMKDSEKKSEASKWGYAIAILCLHPDMEPLFTTAVLLIWTYMESLQDMKTLMNGGKVPLIKTSSQWQTQIISIFSNDTSSQSEQEGLSYEQYLHLLLYTTVNEETKNERLMDIMEMDIRKTEGNEEFQMDWCMDTFTVTVTTESSFGYGYSFSREATYN